MSTESNRSFAFASVDIKDLHSLGQKLVQPQDEVSKHLTAGFSEGTRQSLSSWQAEHQDGDHSVAEAVAQEFNSTVQGPLIYDEQRFSGVNLSNSAITLQVRFRIKRNWQETDVHHFNQVLIKDAYPVEIWRIWLSDVEALKNPGDEEAWREAYDILWPVANQAARKNLSLTDADVQTIAFDAIWQIQKILSKNLKTIESGRALIGLTAQRSRWDARSLIRKKMSLGEVELDPPKDSAKNNRLKVRPELVDTGDAPLEHLCQEDDFEILRKALARLDERQRALLHAFHVEEKDYKELQQQFNLSSDQVGVYLKRAREKLKVFFEEERDKQL